MPARFLQLRLLVRAVRFLPAGLLPRLRNMGCALGQVLPVLLFFVNDFLIVGDVSWIGHPLT